MTIKTCLLVTDDPDDHQAFSEALAEISSRTIVLIILDSEKAITLLNSGKLIPDFVFLDLTTPGLHVNTFLMSIRRGGQLANTQTVLYGEKAVFNRLKDPGDAVFFSKEFEYSELRTFLRRLME